MAAAAIGVDMHDHVLQELLGGHTSLVYEGRDAFEQIWHEYGFQVRTYRETIIIPPADDTLWPWVALALRRDSESLEGAKEESEYIEADHLSMCRFASAGNDGYRSIASFILRLAHHQVLRVSNSQLSPRHNIDLERCSRLFCGRSIARHQKRKPACSYWQHLEAQQAHPPSFRRPPLWFRRCPLVKHHLGCLSTQPLGRGTTARALETATSSSGSAGRRHAASRSFFRPWSPTSHPNGCQRRTAAPS